MGRYNFHQNKCRYCGVYLTQPKTGRTRKYCSNACRQKHYRFRHGSMSRKNQHRHKIAERRRSKPMMERSFDPVWFEEVFVLSHGRKVYECTACGKPYIVDRMKSGIAPSRYCSSACKQRAKHAWRKFGDAFERAYQRGEVNDRVRERLGLSKLSPLCPHCGKPFAPNTDLYGRRQRGRPRKYCSDYCRSAAYERRWKLKNKRARVHRYRICPGCGVRFDCTNGAGRRVRVYHSALCKDRTAKRARYARKKGRAPVFRYRHRSHQLHGVPKHDPEKRYQRQMAKRMRERTKEHEEHHE